MIRQTVMLMLALVTISSCHDNTPTQSTTPTASMQGSKKGVGMAAATANWSSKVSALKVYWHYGWRYYVLPKEPSNVSFVPMDWGGSIANDSLISYLKAKKKSGEAQYLLGFNEPDNTSQSNMTVQTALSLWPRLQEVGLPLGSPATVDPENQWMQDFMAGVKSQGLTVDFICVHYYGGINAQTFLSKLDRVYNLYHLPIWITEFAVADWKATTISQYTSQQVLTYMQTVLPELEQRSYIQRYAWFPASPQSIPLGPSALFDSNGNLTALGQYYAQFDVNAQIGDGKDNFLVTDDAANLITNGNFESGDLSYWGGYNSSLAGVVQTAPHSGSWLGQIANNLDGSLTYSITNPLTTGATYSISVWNKWLTAPSSPVNITVQDLSNNTVLFSTSISNATDWTQTSAQFVCPANPNGVKVVIYKPKSSALYIDDLVLKPL